ncbi:helix-turn-helix domain-containing protein [Cupriavidus basilensis]
MTWNLDDILWARRMKLRHLEVFLTLVESGGITAAAEAMHMTQPAVSHRLKDLEDVVGTAPFYPRTTVATRRRPGKCCGVTRCACWAMRPRER